MKLRYVVSAISLIFLACSPPVHLNTDREKVVVPSLSITKTANDTAEIEKELREKAKMEISEEIKEILKLQNGVNPSDLKPYTDNSIF